MAQKNLKQTETVDSTKANKKPTAPLIDVPKRSFMDTAEPQDVLPSEEHNTESTAPSPTSGKNIDAGVPVTVRKERVIAPLTAEEKPTEAQSVNQEPLNEASEAVAAKPKAETPTHQSTKTESAPTEPKAESSQDPASADANSDELEPTIGKQNSDQQQSSDTKSTAEPDALTEKLKKYSETKQYYLPINAVAKKRSVKVSALLTVIVLLLAIVLIDFMLDSGTILLLQKVPHTHFFSTGKD